MTNNSNNIPDEMLNDSIIDEETNDQEMEQLFATFDEVRASDTLMEKTLAAIAQAAEAEANAKPETVGARAKVVAETKARETTASSKDVSSAHTSDATKSKSPKSRWRVIRTMAIAACLAFACFGGVAYATPAAQVTVQTSQGDIELTVNRFGRTLSAKAIDGRPLTQVGGKRVQNKAYDEIVDLLLNNIDEDNAENVSIEVMSTNPELRKDFTQRGEEILERRGFGAKDAQENTTGQASKMEDTQPQQVAHTGTQSETQQNAPQGTAPTQAAQPNKTESPEGQKNTMEQQGKTDYTPAQRQQTEQYQQQAQQQQTTPGNEQEPSKPNSASDEQPQAPQQQSAPEMQEPLQQDMQQGGEPGQSDGPANPPTNQSSPGRQEQTRFQ